MKFKAKAWKTGTGLVLTIPSALDVKEGDKFLVDLEVIEDDRLESEDNQ